MNALTTKLDELLTKHTELLNTLTSTPANENVEALFEALDNLELEIDAVSAEIDAEMKANPTGKTFTITL